MSKASQMRQKAQDFLKKGKVDKAIEEYKKLLTIESRNPNLHNELGDIFLRANDKVQAVSSFEKASAKYENVALYNNAVAVCKKILRIVPNRNETIYKLGEIKAKQKLLGEAESYFTQFFDAILAEPESGSDNVQDRIENVLEMVPDCEGIWSKASDVFSHIGIKSRAAEVLAHLISRNALGGDPQRLNYYRSRLDLLKQALNREDLEKVEKISVEAQAAAEAADVGANEEAPAGEEKTVVIETAHAGQDEIDEQDVLDEVEVEEIVGADAPDAVTGDEASPSVNSEGISLTDYARDLSGERPEGQAADGGEGLDEAGKEGQSTTGEEEAQEDREYVIGGDDGEEPRGDEPAGAAGPGETVTGEEPEAGSPASVSEDLSDLIDEEDAQIENESSAKNLAEEITSDVEEDDFRSHYDLGMAYIEMGLYADAVKELQISSKSEQLKLQSLEMVGMCFISLDNPRLAVKQLERGLEIALASGQDSLGIHYNLG
ncbi:MAG TPA: tetratricopeptide repeat protein, partial [Candidatus Krumholzibacterium sp.]|nr:tetratricopeptide repeat protein [Candidatus Krumholzibacterium sp.]